MEEEIYGIDIKHAHQRAIELIPEDFFWSGIDELAPFGSDEGDMALAEYREWRRENLSLPLYACLKWTIESISEESILAYSPKMLDRALIKEQIEDRDFNDQQFIFTVDVSAIAVGFGQLVDEGKIDESSKSIIQLAIDRQKIWAQSLSDWEYNKEYIGNLLVLERALVLA